MRNFRIILFTLLSVCSLTVRGASDLNSVLERGRDLFGYGRWSDARHEFLRARALLDPADRAAREEIDYYLAACAVELGSDDA